MTDGTLPVMLRKLLVVLLVVTAAAAVHAMPRPPAASSMTVSHKVLWNGVQVAVVKEQFEKRDGRYHIVSKSDPVGLFALAQRRPATLTSSGRVSEGGRQPERFEGGRGADDARRVSAEFDWAGERLTFTHDGKSERVALPAATQDRLSIMYQFMFFSYEGRREIDFPMTNGRKLDHYRYVITHDVEIDTPLGRMKTLHLVKQRAPDDTQTEVWLSPQHHHLPVKLLIVENDGTRYEEIMTGLEVQP